MKMYFFEKRNRSSCRKLIAISILTGIFYLTSYQVKAQVINVPGDQPAIQSAIDVSMNGDTVLVAPGEYFENINFRNKNIVVCSQYAISYNIEAIYNTIINGSQPVHPDTASCVIIAGGQDSTAVLQGFTLTGGTGTLWEDEHGAGQFYTEGGGILIQYSGPTIKNNIITFNTAVNIPAGAVSAGGGGIRCGDGNPHIFNNIITNNQGKYGAGLVLNYSGAIIKNNIFACNTGGEHYGGGGLWCLSNGASPVKIFNNSIVANHSALGGGGIRLWSCTALLTNNIIWGNSATTHPQIQGSTGIVTYCCVEGGWTGTGNISEDPGFITGNLIPGSTSLCIDHGDPSVIFCDPEDPANPDHALYPAQGGLTCDIGVYGGPLSIELPDIVTGIHEQYLSPLIDLKIAPNPTSQNVVLIDISGLSFTKPLHIVIGDLSGNVRISHPVLPDEKTITVDISTLENGVFIVKPAVQSPTVLCKKLVVLR